MSRERGCRYPTDTRVEPDGVTGVGPGIDWNGDSDTFDTLARNINCRPTNTFTNSSCKNVTRQPWLCGVFGQCYDNTCDLLQDSDDWANLNLTFLLDGDFAPGEIIHCLIDEPAVIVHRANQQQ